MFQIDPQFIEVLEHAWGTGFGHFFVKGKSVRTFWYRGDRIDPEQIQNSGEHFFYAPLPTAAAKSPGTRGLKTDYVSMSLLFVDCDRELPSMDDVLLRPNYIIHTSPNKGHLLYLLREPFIIDSDATRAEAERVWVALSRLLSGDEAARDLGHLGRVPGSMNFKNDPPFKVHLEIVDEAPLREWEELVELCDESAVPIQEVSKTVTNEIGPVQAGDGRLPRLRSEIAKLSRNHKGEALRAMAHAMNEAGTVVNPPYEDTDEIDRMCRTAQAKFGGTGEKRSPMTEDQIMQVLGQAPEFIHPWGRKQAPTIVDYALALEETNIQFMRNQMNGNIHLGDPPLDDEMFEIIHMLMDDKGYHNENRLWSAISIEASKTSFHPIKNYWESKPWDEQDHIGKLSQYFNDKHGMVDVFMRRWLIGSVARMLEQDGTQNRMWVLEGKQGKGKSYFARWLAGSQTRYYREGPLNPDNKDDRLRMLSTWINEVGELGATFRKADRDALKFYLTMQYVMERKPYGKVDIDGLARTSFIGTINDEGGFLTDPTGNRRYMISTITDIDWSYTDDVDVQQLWAQALALYRRGESWNLLSDEVKIADTINESYETDNPEDDYLHRLFEVDTDRGDWFMTNEDIHNAIELSPPPLIVGKLTPARIGRAWRRLGLDKEKKRIDGREKRGWIGLRRKPYSPHPVKSEWAK